MEAPAGVDIRIPIRIHNAEKVFVIETEFVECYKRIHAVKDPNGKMPYDECVKILERGRNEDEMHTNLFQMYYA